MGRHYHGERIHEPLYVDLMTYPVRERVLRCHKIACIGSLRRGGKHRPSDEIHLHPIAREKRGEISHSVELTLDHHTPLPVYDSGHS